MIISRRSSGILLHVTSLPGRFGIGDLGPAALQFLQFLQAAGQRYWQILPLGPTGYGYSPYSAYSAFAANPYLISPELLVEEGVLEAADLLPEPLGAEELVDYPEMTRYKDGLLRRAWQRFASEASREEQGRFELFAEENSWWLEDFALFMALKERHNGTAWQSWEPGLARREPGALRRFKRENVQTVAYHSYLQFVLEQQWQRLRRAAAACNVAIIGDIPVFVAYDSADVWAHPELFQLDEQRVPRVVAGVPPDYFSKTGQRWGNPHYDWERMRDDDFAWWHRRFDYLLRFFDLLRIDHFRGFEAYWAIQAAASTAVDGRWVKAPGAELFQSLQNRIGALPLIAEDLGIITDEVRALRRRFGFPGMKVLQFGLESRDPGNEFLPHNYERNCVAYTGTHDNDTTLGWLRKAEPSVKDFVRRYTQRRSARDHLRAMLRMTLASPAVLSLFPAQDILELDSRHRMNFPGKTGGNWRFRVKPGALDTTTAGRLQELTRLYNR